MIAALSACAIGGGLIALAGFGHPKKPRPTMPVYRLGEGPIEDALRACADRIERLEARRSRRS